jgi:hypothetical protein
MVLAAMPDPRTTGPTLKKTNCSNATTHCVTKILQLHGRLALQLPFPKVSESMGNHDSKIVDAIRHRANPPPPKKTQRRTTANIKILPRRH